MAREKKQSDLQNLPSCVSEFIKELLKKMRYRRKICLDVQAELAAHFEDELKDCKTDEEREQKARRLISDFGDLKMLAVLLRRAKKRCRPLWRTVVARTFQAIGILILCFIVYTIWFITGKPSMRIDYLALLNQMNRPEVLSQDNAWTNYEKAISLFVEPDQELVESDVFKKRDQVEYRVFSDLDPNDQEKIRKWVESNNAAWQEFATGSSKSYCFREHNYASGSQRKSLLDVAMPHLSGLKDLAKMGDWRIRIEIDKGQTRQAMEDCITIARVGSHWQGKANLIEQLVGLGISRLSCDTVLQNVATHNLSAIELKELHQQLARIYLGGYPHINIEGERLMFLDVVQQLFTEGGPGGGHLIPEKLINFSDLTDIGGHPNEYERIVTIPVCTALGMVHARRNETVAMANQIYDHGSREVKMTPYEKRVNNVPNIEDMLYSKSRFRFALIQILMPAIWRCSEIAYRGKALHEATVTIVALKRWQLENNEYPSDLSDLITAGFLKELPMDPYSDKPLVYKRQGDDFILYGLGPNFKDDGGKVGIERGKPRRWGTSEVGDVVYWPLPEPEEE